MRTLPSAWAWARFSDVATVDANLVDPANHRELPHIAPNHIESETGRLLPYATVRDDGVTSAKHLFRPGQILYSKIRPYLAKAVRVSFSGLCSADMYPISTGLEPRFLHYWMLSSEFTAFAAEHQGRSVLPKINRAALATLPVPVPPLAEQQRIVAAIEEHLSRLSTAVSAVTSAARRVDVIERSVLARAQADGEDTELSNLLLDIEAGKSFKTPGRPAASNEWGVIKVSAMTWGEFDERENKAVPADQPVDPRHAIRPGDLLLSRANTSEYVGATVLVGECRSRLLLSDKSMRLITRDGVERRWLRYALASPQVRSQMSLLATGTSDSMRNISQAKVRSLRLRVPALDRQHAVAEEIDEWLRGRSRIDGQLSVVRARAAGLRRSIFAAAFSGELVPQDPDDEPASVLLDRIRTERAPATPTRGRRKAKAS